MQHPDRNRDSSSRSTRPLPTFSPLGEGDFHAQMAASAGVSVVLFSAPHCGACRSWKKLLPQALAGVAGAWYEVDVSEATGVARYYGIFHLPVIYLFRDGRFHAELQCEARPDLVRDTTLALLASPPQDEP